MVAVAAPAGSHAAAEGTLMPGWLDNGFHSHGKRELVPVEVDGLLARAISRSCDLLSDGFVETSWVLKQLTAAQRKRVPGIAVEHRILVPLAAGETFVMSGRARAGLRKVDVSVQVGPFSTDGYVVHDFLDCNRSRAEVEARREAEAKKKRTTRAKGLQQQLETPAEVEARRREAWQGVAQGQSTASPESASLTHVSPGESPLIFEGDSRDRDRVCTTTTEEGQFQNHVRAQRSADPQVQSVLDVLAEAPRLFVDAIGVENAIRAFPGGDAMLAAREVVTLGRDPAWRSTNAANLIWKSLEKQTKPTRVPFDGRGRAGQAGQSIAERLQAMKGGVA